MSGIRFFIFASCELLSILEVEYFETNVDV